MENITKIYGNGFMANKNVNLRVKKGEIHALIGENGAGKSTLMKVLFGQEQPEEGKIIYKGKEVKITNPLVALDHGIGMVHQHFMLAPSLTVAENMVLGIEPKNKGFFDYAEAVRLTSEVSKKYNLPIDPNAKVKDLPVGYKQRVEILKILLRGVDVLILDEPTAVLTPQETDELFVQLRELRKQGYTIIFISHKLKEVKSLCDNLTVLRNGRVTGIASVADLSEQDISRLMVGRDVSLTIEKDSPKTKKTVLKVRNLTYKNSDNKALVSNVSFSIREGEILGIAGVEGNGQREISALITGLEEKQSGDIYLFDEEISSQSIRKLREKGVSHISEDRMTFGTVADASVEENLISDRFYKKEFNKNGLLDAKKIADLSNKLIKEYLVKCDSKNAEIKTLSGGNIQKVVAAREFSANPKLIIANQPTRGIDVGASEFIRKKLISLRDKGSAVLLISADLTEVITVSDSLLVMNEGKIVAYFDDTNDLTEETVGEYMLGIKHQTAEEIGGCCYE
ncbi:ABC transporter ATP-binding protein [Tissierella creatinini]|nr:ABC transporter ATP-binding protein [Tissierella creatinini]TJX64353.1 ABC transporter ATP-binding protein [Soehngenia saccharolytica]